MIILNRLVPVFILFSGISDYFYPYFSLPHLFTGTEPKASVLLLVAANECSKFLNSIGKLTFNFVSY